MGPMLMERLRQLAPYGEHISKAIESSEPSRAANERLLG